MFDLLRIQLFSKIFRKAMSNTAHTKRTKKRTRGDIMGEQTLLEKVRELIGVWGFKVFLWSIKMEEKAYITEVTKLERDALKSIANSTCCGDCREAQRVAQKALEEVM